MSNKNNNRQESNDLSDFNKQKRHLHLPVISNPLKKQKGPLRDGEGKFATKVGIGGLPELKSLNLKRALPLVAVIALVGGFLVYKSFATTAAPYYISSHVNIDGTSKTTVSFRSKDGRICSATNFNTYPASGVRPSYRWTAQIYQGYQWANMVTSSRFSANGNRDQQCFSVKAGATYRMIFKSDGSFGRPFGGTYWIWGYNHS